MGLPLATGPKVRAGVREFGAGGAQLARVTIKAGGRQPRLTGLVVDLLGSLTGIKGGTAGGQN